MANYAVIAKYSKNTKATHEQLTRQEAVKIIIKAEASGATCFLFRGTAVLEYQSPWSK